MRAQAVLAAVLWLTGCASQPVGPTAAVLPAPGKPFDKFAEEDAYCRQYASQQVAGAPEQANSQLVGSAIVGTLLGAGLGAAVGRGPGAAVGAATGTLIGTGAGSSAATRAQMTTQQRYDIAYSATAGAMMLMPLLNELNRAKGPSDVVPLLSCTGCLQEAYHAHPSLLDVL